MSNSKLATTTLLSPCCTVPRKGKILGVAIHCTAGSPDNTALEIARVFQSERRQASCNYAIGGDGSIALVVSESNRAWCTSTGAVDHYAVSIEVASDAAGLIVRPAAVSALIGLLVDICERNNIPRLTWTANKADAANFSKCNMQVHRWFSKDGKSCPGDYLFNLHGEIARRVNARLNGGEKELTEKECREIANKVFSERLAALTLTEAAAIMSAGNRALGMDAGSDWAAVDWAAACAAGTLDGKRPRAFVTREELAAVIMRGK